MGLCAAGPCTSLSTRSAQAGDYLDFAAEVVAAYEGGKPVAIANLMAAPQGTSFRVGDKMLVREDGSNVGTLGDEQLDRQAGRRARELMAMGKNDYIVTDDGVEYFIEAFTTPPTLVLVGGGHVSNAIAPGCEERGFPPLRCRRPRGVRQRRAVSGGGNRQVRRVR